MTSAAYSSFVDSLSLARSLLDLERSYPDPPDSGSEGSVLGLRGGAAILPVAAFENFLRELFIEHLATLEASPTKAFSDLPERIRVNSIFGGLERAMRGQLGIQSTKSDRIAEVVRTAGMVLNERLIINAFAETNSNPSSSTVREMFGKVGIRGIFELARPAFESRWGRTEAETFIADKLDEIVRRRNSVAHSVDVRRLARSDLADAPRFLDCLAVALDGILGNHVVGLCQN